ncbi:MAG: hypothetical protein JST05_00410 [Acidobacteria bacterium]|nr:hypothetical protein [Acidobacteriota bacterium]
MAIQPIKLNLVPEPSLWRERHLPLGWAILGLGAAIFVGVATYTAWSYHRASVAGAAAIHADAQTRLAATREQQILSQLQQIDVDQELPRWHLAEQILSERAAPWSRLAAELEQCLVDGTRLKNVERARGQNQTLLLKVKAESRSRDAEAGFIENLRKDAVFTQVSLDRESQQPGGGWEFDLTLPVAALPPPFVALDASKGPTPSQKDQPAQATLPVAAPGPAPRPQPRPAASNPAPMLVQGPARAIQQRPALGAPRMSPSATRRPLPDNAR